MDKVRQLFTRLSIAILLALFISGVLFAVFSAALAGNPAASWWVGFLQNVSAGAFGSMVTYFLIDLVAQKFNVEERKQSLLSSLGSFDNTRTAEAIRDLWYSEWLQDSSTCGAILRYANLEGNDLGASDLRRVDFYRANLRGAKMWSDLRGAILLEADLEEAIFERPSDSPIPQKIKCIPDGYKEEYPKAALMNHETVLPDGSPWTEEEGIALKRFTDRTHPNFWRSDRWQSPAYKDSDASYRYASTPAKVSDINNLEEQIKALQQQVEMLIKKIK